MILIRRLGGAPQQTCSVCKVYIVVFARTIHRSTLIKLGRVREGSATQQIRCGACVICPLPSVLEVLPGSKRQSHSQSRHFSSRTWAIQSSVGDCNRFFGLMAFTWIPRKCCHQCFISTLHADRTRDRATILCQGFGEKCEGFEPTSRVKPPILSTSATSPS